jgi:LysM repeat protein
MAVSRAAVPATASLTPAATRLEPQKLIYQVKRGDTLSSIARLYNTSVASLKSWNARTIVGTQIHVGDRLTILTSRAARTN